MCAQVGFRVLERILMGDNDPSMLYFGAGTTHGSVEDALVRSTRGGRSRPGGWANEGCCLAALGRMLACYLMRDR